MAENTEQTTQRYGPRQAALGIPAPPPELALAGEWGLYVHVPFCHSQCTYCDFYRRSYQDEAARRYLSALARELAGLRFERPPATIFVGGGTPSALPERQLADLLEALEPLRAPGQEVTFEANPRSASEGKVAMLGAAGVTRVSCGVQSFDPDALRLLGRSHTLTDIFEVIARLRERIPSISLDLIFGHPGQSVEAWACDLDEALALAPDHISVYGLTYERGTPLARAVGEGSLAPVGEEVERAMLALAIERLRGAGLERYEVSNFARPGHRCRHNEGYWAQRDYVGCGPSACSTVGAVRYRNVADWDGYCLGIERSGAPPREVEHLSAADRRNERLILGLRTSAGISLARFEADFGEDLLSFRDGEALRLVEQGLLVLEGDVLRLGEEGVYVADALLERLLCDRLDGSPAVS